ncbi:MAG: hypothetical protein F6K30_26395 [Cyanothece sp. SIO2G6]|nr:hypothetical protein [Cyanothece sp. SIO2G6]
MNSQSSHTSTSTGSNLRKIREEFYGDRPVLPASSPAGYSTPNAIAAALSDGEAAALYALAEEILQNPEQVRQLGDRVYELLQQDIRDQRDRNGYSRR